MLSAGCAIAPPTWPPSRLSFKCRKLRGKYVGPFPIVAVHSPIAIEVRLPSWLHANLHHVFHSMYLRPAEKKTTDTNLKQQLKGVFDSAQ
eukprot:COSAG06_NODE_4686_length_4036_cov_7.714757_5_plen_90_part_00